MLLSIDAHEAPLAVRPGEQDLPWTHMPPPLGPPWTPPWTPWTAHGALAGASWRSGVIWARDRLYAVPHCTEPGTTACILSTC